MKNVALAIGFYLATSLVTAADLNALVLNKNGKPVADAVVLASGVTIASGSAAKDLNKSMAQADVDQLGQEFVPYVTAVQVGTLINFPNKDTVKHHVYSFSPSKKFDLPLYSGTSAPPVRFDKPGIVVIGCNIHDWMIGYIYVADTPYFVKSDSQGKATLKDLPAGKYSLRVWHPDAANNEESTLQTAEIGSSSAEVIWHIDIKPRVNPRHNSMPDINSY